MEKSIYSEEYDLLRKLLRDVREEKGLTQTDVAERLGQTQSFVSKIERGERRLDLLELRSFCNAVEIPLGRFITRFERELRDSSF